MSRLVHIPETLSEIEDTITQKTEQLAWWTDKLNRSRKNSLRAMRAMHANAIRAELEALKNPSGEVFLSLR